MRLLKLSAMAAGALLTLAPLVAQVNSYKEIKTPQLHKMAVPQAKRVVLDNGMVVFFMEDHGLPLIRGGARVRGGERDVPADKVGLANIYGQAWRTGGTESKTGDQLDDFLESRGAKVETSASDDSTSISLNVLKSDFDNVFPIFVDLLQHPSFRQEKVDLAKTQANTGISRRNDDPMSLGGREAAKLAYGANSPYARQREYSTIAAITRDDLVAMHKRYVHPNNIILGFTGDFDPAVMEQKVRSAFGSWPKGPQASAAAPTDIQPAKPGVYFISKDDVTQSNIYLIHGGTTRNNPDFYSLQVMNEVLSGGFSGRLMNDIRSARGLAYGVGGGVGTEWDHPGVFRIWMGTKSGSTVEAIKALRGDVADLQTKPITDEELSLAKEAILNSYIFTMDSRAKVLQQRVNLEFYGYPATWYDQYVSGIEKVTRADVERVAKKYVHSDQMSLLVVGKDKDFDAPLASVGTVSKIDVTIPEPGAKPAGSAPMASTPDGLALARKAQDFVGGKAKLATVQAIRTVGTLSVKSPQGPMDIEVDSLTKYPDSHRNIMKMPMGEMTMVSTPEAAFMSSPMGTQDMPGSQREMMKSESRQDFMTIVRNLENPAYTFTIVGSEKIGDVNTQILEVGTGTSSVKWWVDPASGKVLRRSGHGRGGEQITDITEWKSAGGLTVASNYTTKVNGEQQAAAKITTIEINPTYDPKVFDKPAAKQ